MTYNLNLECMFSRESVTVVIPIDFSSGKGCGPGESRCAHAVFQESVEHAWTMGSAGDNVVAQGPRCYHGLGNPPQISIGRNHNMVRQHHSSHDLGAVRLCCRVRGELGLFSSSYSKFII